VSGYSGESTSTAISEPAINSFLDSSNWTVATGQARASATNTKSEGVPAAAAVPLDNERLLWIFGGAAALVLVWNLTRKH
jgi:hypothetical protein